MNSIRQWYVLSSMRMIIGMPIMYWQVHVERVLHTYSKPNIITEARKLMHRFTEEQVEELIDQAEGHS